MKNQIVVEYDNIKKKIESKYKKKKRNIIIKMDELNKNLESSDSFLLFRFQFTYFFFFYISNIKIYQELNCYYY